MSETKINEKEPDETTELEKRLEEHIKLAEERLTQLKYLKADFENLQKQHHKEKEEHSKYAGEKLITELLPVLDTLDAALAAEKNKSQREGLAMLQKQIAGVLEKNGLAPISAHGTAFDPYYHEAVLKE
ncbi:MAG: nucleotide exchange factor GrpE, partial [Candidatus Altiarchaeota archaeon]|nr:nucleotide exchange factor GrpE [Candidatus Altiarchaeota archaeon]